MSPSRSLFSLFFLIALIGCSTGCPLDPFRRDNEQLVIMSYNVQNLFDDIDQGSEYAEYDPSSGKWTTDAYLAKLASLAAAIRKSPWRPDILLLQEIENRNALLKLCRDFLPLYDLHFVAAPAAEGAAVQTAVASRRAVTDLIVHRAGERMGERNILEIRLSLDGDEIIIFNNHWKSRLGGEEETEPERIRSALLIRRRLAELAIAEPEIPVVIAGDFNEDPCDISRSYPAALTTFTKMDGSDTVIRLADSIVGEDPESEVQLYSGWSGNEGEGSYFYAGTWERIDHFFWTEQLCDGKGWEVREFLLLADPLLLTEGIPFAFHADRMEGYSDHLPLLLVLIRE